MRSLDRSDLWFGIVLTALFSLVAVALYGGLAAGVQWGRFLPLLGFFVAVSLLRPRIERLGRPARFFSWFGIGAAVAGFAAWSRVEGFSPWVILAFGLGLATLDLIGDLWSERRQRVTGRYGVRSR